jgi:hypothetical protein
MDKIALIEAALKEAEQHGEDLLKKHPKVSTVLALLTRIKTASGEILAAAKRELAALPPTEKPEEKTAD